MLDEPPEVNVDSETYKKQLKKFAVRLDTLGSSLSSIKERSDESFKYLKVTLFSLSILFTCFLLFTGLLGFLWKGDLNKEQERITAVSKGIDERLERFEEKISHKITTTLGLGTKKPNLDLFSRSLIPLNGSKIKATLETYHVTDEEKKREKFPFYSKADATYQMLRIPYIIKNTGSVVYDGKTLAVLYTGDEFRNIEQEVYGERSSEIDGFGNVTSSINENVLPPDFPAEFTFRRRLPNDFQVPDKEKEIPIIIKIFYDKDLVTSAKFTLTVTQTRDTKPPIYVDSITNTGMQESFEMPRTQTE